MNRADLGFKADDLGAVFAQHAGGRWGIRKRRVVCAIFSFDFNMAPVLCCEDLGAVGAGATIGRGVFARLFNDAFGEGFQHFGVVAKVA